MRGSGATNGATSACAPSPSSQRSPPSPTASSRCPSSLSRALASVRVDGWKIQRTGSTTRGALQSEPVMSGGRRAPPCPGSPQADTASAPKQNAPTSRAPLDTTPYPSGDRAGDEEPEVARREGRAAHHPPRIPPPPVRGATALLAVLLSAGLVLITGAHP